MGKFLVLFFCVAIISTASALKCYSCKGTGCDTDSKLWDQVMCGASGVQPYAGHEWVCLKLNYKDRVTYKDMVQRKCVPAEMKNGKPVFNCPTVDGEPSACPVCKTDLCNSASTVNFSMVAFSGIVLALLAPKFM